MKCFYHGDLDGQASAYCVYRLYDIEDIEFIKMDYKDPFPFVTIRPNERVWIVDFSLTPQDMTRLLSITQGVTWIDHHATAIEKYVGYPHDITGVRKDGVAACVLTWKFCFPGKPVPKAIEYVGDRDIWAWKHGDTTRHFFAGSLLYDTSPKSKFWDDCVDNEEARVPVVIAQGVEKLKQQRAADAKINELGFETEFQGYNCWAINRPRASSDRLEGRDEKYDIVMVYLHDGMQFVISMYSKKVDVSAIAKQYGGGGHKGAAGFQWPTLPFTKKV